MQKIIAIVGPTASGKTKLAIEIAKKYNGECINFDATQIFKGTDIATNKCLGPDQEGVVHHMLSIKEVDQTIDVVEYRNQARILIAKLLNKKIIPILVGGTGYYLLGVVKNYSFFGPKREPEKIPSLKDLNPATLTKITTDQRLIKGTDEKRLVRKLELHQALDLTRLDLNKEDKYIYDNLIIIGLNPERQNLYEYINERVLHLVDQGLFAEITQAYKDNNYNEDAQALKCIGGKEIIAYLKKEISYEEAILAMQKNNRNYAKRQMTYFRNKFANKVIWFNHNFSNFSKCVDDVLAYLATKLN